MFKFIKKLFAPKVSIVDKLVQFFGPSTLHIWNCVNDDGKYCSPVEDVNCHDWKTAKHHLLKIGFGTYMPGLGDFIKGENDVRSIIEVWIDSNLNIIWDRRNQPYLHGNPHRNEKLIDKLYDQISKESKFLTGNQKLRDWIGTLFRATPRTLYAHRIAFSCITISAYPMLDYVLEELTKEEERLAKEDIARAEHERMEKTIKPAPVTTPSEEDVESLLGIEHKKEKTRRRR